MQWGPSRKRSTSRALEPQTSSRQWMSVNIAGGVWWFSCQSCLVMSLEGVPAALGQGDMFLVVFFLQHQWGKLILFYMPSHALLSDSLRQKRSGSKPLSEGSTMMSDLNVLVLALTGGSLPRKWCSFPSYFVFSSYCLCITFWWKKSLPSLIFAALKSPVLTLLRLPKWAVSLNL